MQLRYDEDWVEQIVFLCASGRRPGVPALQLRRFYLEREKPYAILDPDKRNAAFFAVHLEWFREWGLEDLLLSAMNRFPRVREGTDVLAFRQARSPSEEGAELYVSAKAQRTAVVACRVRRFENDEPLKAFLHREFLHIADMLDPEFQYSPGADAGAANPRLFRERYRLLWNVAVDARLSRTGLLPVTTQAERRCEFNRGFSFWEAGRQEEVFDELWNDSSPVHPRLVTLAADPRGIAEAHIPTQGGLCPLCRFPTFQWASGLEMAPEVQGRIRNEFPTWAPEMGLCCRCMEILTAPEPGPVGAK